MLSYLAELLHKNFATDQDSYAQHQPDGKYRRKYGAVTKRLLERTLKSSGSIAIYQKNNDLSINWICLDFDISKSNLGNDRQMAAQVELEKTVKSFCCAMDAIKVPYLLEFSGRRGFHVWITLSEKTSYRVGYEVLSALIESAKLDYDKSLISLDLFPSTGTPTDGAGLGVKVPLSKHTKSNNYAVLLKGIEALDCDYKFTELTDQLIEASVGILNDHRGTNKSELESALGTIFDFSHDDGTTSKRIKFIEVQNNSFGLSALLAHWSRQPPLKILGEKIKGGTNITHEERKLLVGMLHNIYAKNIDRAGVKLLLEIFSLSANYSPDITRKSIEKLSSFNFPSQEQVESATKSKFLTELSLDELVNACIPTVRSFKDGTFEISRSDIEITKIAELNYLYLNDEAHSKLVINELSSIDSQRLYWQVQELLDHPKAAEFYRHSRNEPSKTRELITLKTRERIATSCILKQFNYFLNLTPSPNSHGYRPNKGFKDGYIFKPWLYLWIKFVSNISSAISDPENRNYYIVKTDIKSFYDTIPHDNVKRMLLGGVNERIDARLGELPQDAKETYKKYIDAIFEITEKTVGSKIGLPQGPAYARYFAELYLDAIDQKFDSKLQVEDIYLYQRYVDDVFIIAPSETAAQAVLLMLREELELIGLKLNDEKTSITKITNFSKDFNEYRSQSKYAVDKVSKNFADSTPTEKNLAISEFIKLVQSDSCNEDLAFIFSHLAGVQVIDDLKREKVEPTLRSKAGRGSLYKHLFNFVLESSENWDLLSAIEDFDVLQSEVLSACLITAIESNKSDVDGLRVLAGEVQKKLQRSALVGENLAYLYLVFGVDIELSLIATQHIVDCLVSIQECDNLKISSRLIERLNTSLNDIKELPRFIEALYPLCASSSTLPKDLNDLAATFYAKLSSDQKNGLLSTNSQPEIRSASTASKFYYLLCLFSISNRNKSPDLLRNAWKYCAHVHNSCDLVAMYRTPEWFKKIGTIEYSQENALLLISTIVDGNIFRGLEDKAKIFEKFHSLLLVYLTLQRSEIKDDSIEHALEELKDKADFYKWLIEKDGAVIFPTTNKLWFEKNIIENSTIVLKRHKEILFRKPSENFHSSSDPRNEHNGYSEIIVGYAPEELRSLSELISGNTSWQKLKMLLDVMTLCQGYDSYPNIFSRDRLLKGDSLIPFSEELSNSRSIIVEDRNGNVETLINSQKNFIRSYLKFISGDDFVIGLIKDKYIESLDEDVNLIEFTKHLLAQIEEGDGLEDEFYLDLAAASALYLSIGDLSPGKKIERFVDQYHRFNKDDKDRHLYAVNQQVVIADTTPVELLNTIEESVKIIPKEVIPYSTTYLHIDIENYRQNIIDIIERHECSSLLSLANFKRVRPSISQISELIHVNGKDYKFQSVHIVNVTTNEVHQFEVRSSSIINSSEHVYAYEDDFEVYLLAMSSSLTKIYSSVSKRNEAMGVGVGCYQSYPTTILDEQSIFALNGFSAAVEVVSIHRDIAEVDARAKIIRWLSSLPRKFHQMLVTLISAHVVMHKEDIRVFGDHVESLLLDAESNPFLIKHIGDYNGTHRVLFKDGRVGRTIESLSPVNIRAGSERATIIVDAVITGSQIMSALKYYITGDGGKPGSKFFPLNESDKITLSEKLKKLKHLDICTILYSSSAISNILAFLRLEANSEITVNVVCGKDVECNALFGSTDRIGALEKQKIREILKDKMLLQELHDHLEELPKYKASNADIDDVIDSSNLVARYQSLPKKSFRFLYAGLRHDPDCHPLMRIKELND